jgi:hypothetical protein
MELFSFPRCLIENSSMAYPALQDGFLVNRTGHEACVQAMVPAVMKNDRY